MRVSLYQPGSDQNTHNDRRRRAITRTLPGAAFLLFALPALWPFVRLGLTFSADGLLHVLRVAMLEVYQREGMFFPRWMPDLVLGYGYPLLSFYGSATYYLASLFGFFGADPAQALLLTFVLILLLAGWGMYLFVFHIVEESTDPWRRHGAAMVGAVAYLYAPYLLLNTYARGAVAEVGAQMLLPWILWFLRRIFYASNPTPYALGFALSTALLALTHNISLLFMPPMIVAFGLAVIWQARALQQALPQRVSVTLLAGTAAMGVSAFFWLPLLFGRNDLADTAFAIAERFVAENVWTLDNFLDFSWPYVYSTAIPFQLGAVQVSLAVLGFLMLPRRTSEWWVLLVVSLVACLMISAQALPLWLNSQVLLIAQFPWRLLAIASLPLALFPVGIILRIQQRWTAMALTLALITLIILSQRPPVASFVPLLDQPVSIGRPATAQFEFQTDAYGTSMSSEFMPRWAGQSTFGVIENPPATAAPIPSIQLQTATPLQIEAIITATAVVDLHIANFYFPGWSATKDGQPTQLGPDPVRGLQTLTLPIGTHRIVIGRQGMSLERMAGWLSLLTLMALAIGVWLRGERWRWLASMPILCFLAGAYITVQPASYPTTLHAVAAPIGSNSLELLGYRYQIEEGRLLHLFPYWLLHTPTDSKVHWQIVNAEGETLTELSSDAFFNTLRLASIPALTLFDDAYQLALPPGLDAGEYELRVAVGSATPEKAPSFYTVGALQLPDVPEIVQPEMDRLDLRFDSTVLLDGWSVSIDGRPVTGAGTTPLVLHSGQVLEYTLYWRADSAVEENYHGFIHLLDHTRQAARQYDKTAGSLAAPARLWNPFYVQPDTYRFVLDDTTPGGLYWPTVGLYRSVVDRQRLPIADRGGEIIGGDLTLPALKVISSATTTPARSVNARLGEWGELQGFSILPASGELAGGDVVTLTLVYKALASAPVDYTRFIHLHNQTQGMAAQQDAPPLNGGNPTTSWVAGEQIVETVILPIPEDAQPGEYAVWFGMYDPANGQRAALRDRTDFSLHDNRLLLGVVSIVDKEAEKNP